jgi:hypothetical protein
VIYEGAATVEVDQLRRGKEGRKITRSDAISSTIRKIPSEMTRN